MLRKLFVDLSNYGRSIKGITVVVDHQSNVLILLPKTEATRLFGDAELLRNVTKDSVINAKSEILLESIETYPTLEEFEKEFIKAIGPVSVRFINETL